LEVIVVLVSIPCGKTGAVVGAAARTAVAREDAVEEDACVGCSLEESRGEALAPEIFTAGRVLL